MISWHDFYVVLTAMVPLYVAMILAYASVRWWKIFTPDQCSGINRFVAVFAVPLLSFHFISKNNIYTMNFRFIAADTLQKAIMLLLLGLWANLSNKGSLEWSITIFSLSTLPNTLVMGIPLLIAMYDNYSGDLMVQLIVLQCIVWYTLLLFLFEFRAARILISERFPDTAADIVSVKVESDVVSLDGQDFLETDAEIGNDGKLHVSVRKSNASRRSSGVSSRPSNLTGAEIYSVSSSRRSNFNHADFHSMMGMGRLSNFGNSDTGRMSSFNVVEMYPSTPRPSNFEENAAPKLQPPQPTSSYPAPNPEITSVLPKTLKKHPNNDSKDLHMFVWSSHVSEGGGADALSDPTAKDIRLLVADNPQNGEPKEAVSQTGEDVSLAKDEEKEKGGANAKAAEKGKNMPSARVMTRLILIMVWRKLIRNPNTYSSIIGLIWSLVSFRWNVHMPKIVEQSIKILSDTGLGMAMFSLGLFMALQPKIIACGKKVAILAMAVRFLSRPAVMAVASIAVGLRGTLLRIAIVQAALPQGIVPFVFAKEYNVHAQILSTAVIFGMLIAIPITLVYYILLDL